MWIERGLRSRLIELAEAFPAVVVTGARQTGKTSLLQRVFPQHRYVSLDLPLVAAQAEEAPESFLRAHPPPVVIDEVQYAPGLFRFLKIVIDQHRNQKGRFILTGSQKFTLMKEVSDSLAGRCGLMELPGLSADEIASTGFRVEDATAYGRLMTRGAFPELWADGSIPTREFYRSYLATYLERDLRQLIHVGSLRDFERFVRACAARSGGLLNKSDLARDVGVSSPTINAWISALEASNQITLLEPYFGNVGKRLVKSPKLYLNDTGLLCFLLGVDERSIEGFPLKGAIWESYVLAELVKWTQLHRPEWTLWFYRDQQNHEADFLLQGPYQHIRLLDAKWAEMPKHHAFDSLETVSRSVAKTPGVTDIDLGLVTRSKDAVKVGKTRHHVGGAYLGTLFANGAADDVPPAKS